MSALFITGAGTDVGKTYVTAGLLRYLRGAGQTAQGFKPVATGFEDAHAQNSDAAALLEAMGVSASAAAIAAISPLRFRAPLSPDMAALREGRSLLLTDILGLCKARLAQAPGPLLIEGVGGVMSPIASDATCLDLAASLSLRSLIVAGSYLGAITHALTAQAACRERGVEVCAMVVSDSASSPVSLAETCATLEHFAKGALIFALPRNAGAEDFQWSALARNCGLEDLRAY